MNDWNASARPPSIDELREAFLNSWVAEDQREHARIALQLVIDGAVVETQEALTLALHAKFDEAGIP